MKSRPVSRKEKLQALKDLQTGKLSINELRPEKVYFWNCDDEVYCRWPDEPATTSNPITRQEFQEFHDNNQGKHIVFVNVKPTHQTTL
ncbi:hypothetical protein SAMN05444008_10934 [Cnuella takakiae]|uniref:Uncharacterized protein n=1 Tax=Cnuella takakiae TaxID=1302690 RepID=A0A1M5CEB2_9BACT|nr:hypothetical protein [Cnuella takakiae]OLY91786.1 hypothetical protein BUE76_07655 [Cnuella takakiae]SHF53083.1 hypothetical protein SAMN05444008_10934 [Cnuella takakiae]